MKKTIIILILFWFLPTLLLAETELKTNPDGPVGSIILTCLGGIHTGSGDIKYGHGERRNVSDLSGYIFSIKMETPISKSSTFLLLFNYDKQRTLNVLSSSQTENFAYDITVIGGFKFFIKR